MINAKLLQLVIEASNDGIVVAEQEGDDNILIYANPAFERLTGYAVDDILYRDCRFTFFPSFYEGWGLPVTESLSFGRVCLASDRASVPEAGGRFCAYLDPDNATGATAAARALIGNPEHLAALEADIRDGFRPVPWSDTAAAVLAALG